MKTMLNPRPLLNAVRCSFISILAIVGSFSCSEDKPCEGIECIPEGCEFLEAEGEEARCVGSDARCEQAREESPTTRRYWISLDEEEDDGSGTNLDQEEIERRTACLGDWLEALGNAKEQITEPTTLGTVIVNAEWASVVQVLHSAAVERYELYCAPGLCAYCNDYDEADCEADAFCTARTGTPIDVERECSLPSRFSYCAGFDTGSCEEDLSRLAIDEEGQCWEFLRICHSEPRLDYGEDVCGPELSPGMPLCGSETDAGAP